MVDIIPGTPSEAGVYDDHPYLFDPYGDPPGRGRELDRLTHLVLVDGRLVDTWSEPVRGTPWERHADRFDRELLRATEPPPKPAHQRVLEWLDSTCGSRAAVLALTGDPLLEDGLDLPEVLDRAARDRLEDCAAALDAVAGRWFDAEVSFAMRRGLLLLWADDPEMVTGARSAPALAGGLCWAVGKANGLFRPQGDVTMQRVQDVLGTTGSLSSSGQRVRLSLHGYRGWPLDALSPLRVPGVPDLQPLGRPDLLLGTVRQRLVRLRDRALTAQADDDFYRAG